MFQRIDYDLARDELGREVFASGRFSIRLTFPDGRIFEIGIESDARNEHGIECMSVDNPTNNDPGRYGSRRVELVLLFKAKPAITT